MRVHINEVLCIVSGLSRIYVKNIINGHSITDKPPVREAHDWYQQELVSLITSIQSKIESSHYGLREYSDADKQVADVIIRTFKMKGDGVALSIITGKNKTYCSRILSGSASGAFMRVVARDFLLKRNRLINELKAKHELQ